MGRSQFEAYGELACTGVDPTAQAGRYATQREAERLIVLDLLPKLALTPTCHLLEIGCGSGNLLIPLSFLVATATGLDHPNVVSKGRQRFSATGIDWIGGEFPRDRPDQKFDRILVYSVLHCLPDFAAVSSFVRAAAALLGPSGRLVLGDIPNKDCKHRFIASEFGRAFDAQWRAAALAAGPAVAADTTRTVFDGISSIGTLDDQMMLDIVAFLRADGFHATIVSQAPDLPFGHTREDIVVIKP
jgi:2-polyprenyl-3-methyl-5-hydroxy-6-metoxy-1,4-benzoquinol methylase